MMRVFGLKIHKCTGTDDERTCGKRLTAQQDLLAFLIELETITAVLLQTAISVLF
jgi:hypothetical protein